MYPPVVESAPVTLIVYSALVEFLATSPSDETGPPFRDAVLLSNVDEPFATVTDALRVDPLCGTTYTLNMFPLSIRMLNASVSFFWEIAPLTLVWYINEPLVMQAVVAGMEMELLELTKKFQFALLGASLLPAMSTKSSDS